MIPIKSSPKRAAATFRLLVSTADSIGFDPLPLLKNQSLGGRSPPAEIDLSTIQLVPVYRAWMETIRKIRYAEFNRIAPTSSTSELLIYSVIGCGDLSEVVTNITRHIESSQWSEFSFSESESSIALHFKTEKNPSDMTLFIWDLFGMCFLQKMFSWLIGEPLFNLRIGLAHHKLVDTDLIEAVAGCPVSYGEEYNSLTFHKHMLSKRVVKTYGDVRETLQIMPMELMPTPYPRHLSRKLESIILESLQNTKTIPTAEQIAAQIGSSSPTLRRRVAREGSSFQQLVEKCRKEKAIELLHNYRMSIETIADQLGFSTASGFSRAFKEWTGLAPSEYRNTYSFAANQR